MKYKIGDLIQSISETKNMKEIDEVIFLNTGDILDGKILHGIYSNPNDLPGQAKKSIKNHDILYSEIRPKNKRFAMVNVSNPESYVVSTKLMVLRTDENLVNTNYMYYYLTSPNMIDYLQGQAESRSGTFPQITFQELKNLVIELPNLDQQERTVAFLSKIDSKIELNNQMIATLEELAATLFKQWFVDFEFPDENGNPYKSSGGKMMDSELGEIPEGWSTNTLGSQVSFEYGKSLTKSQRNFGTIPVYGSNGIVDYHDKELVSGPGIIIGRKGTVGTVKFSSKDFFPIDTTFWLKILTDTKPINYFYFLLKNLNLDNLTSDSAVPGLNRKTALRTEIVVPAERIINHFERTVESFRYLSDEIEDNISLLGDVRDSLLPKILSGEIEV